MGVPKVWDHGNWKGNFSFASKTVTKELISLGNHWVLALNMFYKTETWTATLHSVTKKFLFLFQKVHFLRGYWFVRDISYATLMTNVARLRAEIWQLPGRLFNRPGVAGAVLQTTSSLIYSDSQWVSQSAFSSKSSRYHKSQTIRARELKFSENVHPPQHVIYHVSRVKCHVSRVTCHMSCVTCHMSYFFFFFFFDEVVKLIGGGSVINGAYRV